MGTEEPESGELVYITNLENGLQMNGTEMNDKTGPDEKKPVACDRPIEMPSLNNSNHEFDIYGETGSDAERIEDFPKERTKRTRKNTSTLKRMKKKKESEPTH